jgi:hypothetical protein
VLQSITAQHLIARPVEAALRLWAPASLLEDGPEGDGLAELHRLF